MSHFLAPVSSPHVPQGIGFVKCSEVVFCAFVCLFVFFCLFLFVCFVFAGLFGFGSEGPLFYIPRGIAFDSEAQLFPWFI